MDPNRGQLESVEPPLHRSVCHRPTGSPFPLITSYKCISLDLSSSLSSSLSPGCSTRSIHRNSFIFLEAASCCDLQVIIHRAGSHLHVAVNAQSLATGCIYISLDLVMKCVGSDLNRSRRSELKHKPLTCK